MGILIPLGMIFLDNQGRALEILKDIKRGDPLVPSQFIYIDNQEHPKIGDPIPLSVGKFLEGLKEMKYLAFRDFFDEGQALDWLTEQEESILMDDVVVTTTGTRTLANGTIRAFVEYQEMQMEMSFE